MQVNDPSRARRWFEGADPPLFGRGALVTGAGRGIGTCDHPAAGGLRRHGALRVTHPIGAGRNGQNGWLEGFCARLGHFGGRAAKAMVDALLARVASLDILVHCAGIMQTGSVEGMNLIDFDRAFEINVRSPYALTQAALRP